MSGSFPSWADSRLDHSGDGEHASRAERLLCTLGADPGFVQSVLGDVAEERAARSVTDGPRAATWWYAREALRSVPHLVANAIGGAGWRRRVAAMLGLGAIAFAVTFAVRSMLGERGAPAQLLASGDPMHVPRLAIVGANCEPLGIRGFMCVTLRGAELFAFHERDGDQARAVRGTVLVWRHPYP